MNLPDIKKLASLARLDIPEAELEGLAKEFDAILSYVDQVRSVPLSGESVAAASDTENQMREDGTPHAGRLHTEQLLAAMPDSENGYLKVKRIL